MFWCFAGKGEHLQVLGSSVWYLAAAATAVGDERRVCQSASPTSHGEEDSDSARCGKAMDNDIEPKTVENILKMYAHF